MNKFSYEEAFEIIITKPPAKPEPKEQDKER